MSEFPLRRSLCRDYKEFDSEEDERAPGDFPERGYWVNSS